MPESPLEPFLRGGCEVAILEILEGNLDTFRCDSCGNIGFVIGRRRARFCSKRCNSTGPTARAQKGVVTDFKVDIRERLQRRQRRYGRRQDPLAAPLPGEVVLSRPKARDRRRAE